MNDKVCCYKCGGLGHVARIKCEDGSFLYCATITQISNDILNAIQYPHIPSAAERRNPPNARAAQEEQPAEEPEDEEAVESQWAAANAVEAEEDPYEEY